MGYHTRQFPLSRIATIDVGRIGRAKHHVAGLFEVDVTVGRRLVREEIRNGRDVSFLAWIIASIATTVKAVPEVQAVRTGRRKIAVFDSVDISTMIEREVDGTRVPLVGIIRDAESKMVEEIFGELEGKRHRSVSDEHDYVLHEATVPSAATRIYYRLPQSIRLLVWKLLLRNPGLMQTHMGTMIVTNVGGAGGVAGWMIPKSTHPFMVGIGSITKLPRVVAGNRVEPREVLHLTVLFDHDVIDGAPATRFVRKLVTCIESARCLEGKR